jgi:hypothetical protein
MNRNIVGPQVDVDEFWRYVYSLRYLAVLLLVTIHGKACARDNWSQDPLYQTPVFRTIMTVSAKHLML